MNRLTHPFEGGIGSMAKRETLIARLARYEALEQTPRELLRQRRELLMAAKTIRDLKTRLEHLVDINYSYELKYGQAEREGRLLILPERPRPLIYRLNDHRFYCPNCLIEIGEFEGAEKTDPPPVLQCKYCGQLLDETESMMGED